MEKTLLNIKMEKNLKHRAQEVARELGLPLSTVVNAYLREFVREKRVVFSSPPAPNAKTQRLLAKLRKDVAHGKNAAGPFTQKEAMRFLGRR